MATKRMDDLSLKPLFEGSYSHLEWTMEEEDAFNLIQPLEWPKPSLRTRFNRAVKAIVDDFILYAHNHPYYLYPQM